MSSPIILLHGALGSRDQFAGLRRLLSDDYDVYDIDFTGHGSNKENHEFSMERFVTDVVIMMERKGLPTASFFGYSMGGYVALQLAINFPSLVNKVITLATKFHWTPESAEEETRRLIPEKVEAKVPAFATSLRMQHGEPRWKEVMNKTRRMMTALGNGEALKPEDFKVITHPVMLMVGELDHMVSFEETANIANALPRGAMRVIDGGHHPFESIDPQLIADEIRMFV